MADNLSQLTGLYIPTTNVWDVDQIYQIDIGSPEFKELLVRLYQNINNMSLALNLKDSGFYDTAIFVNGQLFFPNPSLTSATDTAPDYRQVLRKTINFGALPNAGSKSVAHGITVTDVTTFTRIYATASDTTGHNYISIPYASPTLANNIELRVDGTNVTIITGSDRTSFNVCYVIVEYITT